MVYDRKTRMELITKTIIPHTSGVYSAFPTLVTWDDQLYMFYRQGRPNRAQMHGLNGTVRCFQIALNSLRAQFNTAEESIYPYGQDYELPFHSPNELDAIASRLDDTHYTLATRSYILKGINQPYISFSSQPVFSTRMPVNLPELIWLVFYGRAFAAPAGWIFPAYGSLKADAINRPLLLISRDQMSLELLTTLPSQWDGQTLLNEHSIVFDGQRYISFIRQDSPPFGIWYATSVNLLTWSEPRQLYAQAHAPTALQVNETLYLAWRDLSADRQTRIRLATPWAASSRDLILDTYFGNPYDGGYSSLLALENALLVAYYLGNEAAEPHIKMAKIDI